MPNISTFRSLKYPGFRLYLIGMFGHMAAMNMLHMSLSLLIYRITGSAKAIGIAALASVAPHILSSLYGGVIADRFEKKHILMSTIATFAVLSYGIAVTLMTGWLNQQTWWLLVIVTICHAILMGLLAPARDSIIPNLVGPEMLMNAVSLHTFGRHAWRLMAPAAAGFLIEGFGFAAVYSIMGAFYTWAIIFISFIPVAGNTVKISKRAFLEIREGFKYLRSETEIMWVLIFNLFAVLLSQPYENLLPVFADDILKVGAGGLGVLVSVSGIGAMAGSLILASLPNKKRGLMLLSGTMFLGLAIIIFSFSKSWMLSLMVMVFIGMGQSGRMTLSSTLAQQYSSDDFRGRVMGINDMQMSFPGLAVFAIGILSETIGVEWAVGGFAMLLVAVSMIIMAKVPPMRYLD